MSASPGVQVQEFKVRIPKRNDKKVFHVMKFNASLKVDPPKWSHARMARENNKKDHKGYGDDEETPKFGAGSEFGKEARDEARRKKYGRASKKYNPDAQPWILRIGSKKEAKYYRGLQDGGVSENTAYYVFTHAQDGSFEAHPIKDWYNFTPRVTHKTLNSEEAEERFAERGKILNHWAMMVNKKLKPDQEKGEDEDKAEKGRGAKASKGLKISDMDDWIESGDELGSDDDDEEGKKKRKDSDDEGGAKSKKKGTKDSKKKKKTKKDKSEADLEGNEDSDDGDDDGREVDYMSDASSESEEEILEQRELKGVDQDKGLSKMLDSDSDSDEEDKDKDKDKEEENEEDSDNDDPKKKKKKKKKQKSDDKDEKGSKNNSRSNTPGPDGGDSEKTVKAEKRKAMVDNLLDPNAESAAKKSRLESFGSAPSTSSTHGSLETGFEDDVRRYLARKPMTTMELLKKFTTKRTGLTKEELTNLLVNVLKKINPHKQKVKGTMYLSLKKT